LKAKKKHSYMYMIKGKENSNNGQAKNRQKC
jgi:hypothetical protein